MSENTPLVSVCTLAYNHEPYIRECLDGILMQKTNFAFELLIHDDASTDGTADIIREYETKYPDIIKPIYQTENQYSKGVKVSLTYQYPRAKGKYIAMCEGDDYWTDPLKLQKQVDFMEANTDCSLCFHNAEVIYEDKNKKTHIFANIEDREYTGAEIYEKWIIPTASILFRLNSLNKIKHKLLNKNFIYGDSPLFIALSEVGKLWGINNVMSVYRINSTGVTNYINKNPFKVISHHKTIKKTFKNKAIKRLSNYFISVEAFYPGISSIKDKNFIKGIKLILITLLYNKKILFNYIKNKRI